MKVREVLYLQKITATFSVKEKSIKINLLTCSLEQGPTLSKISLHCILNYFCKSVIL